MSSKPVKIRRRRFNGEPTKRITAEVTLPTYQALIAGDKSLGWSIDELVAKYATNERNAKTP